MSDDQARINIICDRKIKLEAKKTAASLGMDRLNEAYLNIFKLGLKEFKKLEVKK